VLCARCRRSRTTSEHRAAEARRGEEVTF
jgi:hypothetical protein